MSIRHLYQRPVFAILAAIMILAGSMSSGVATAQGATDRTTAEPGSVWCGLWSGSNFEIQGNCSKPATTTSASAPAHPRADATGHTNNVVRGRYAALGDSVAAGLGLPAGSYTGTTDAQCGRSEQGYPNTVASTLRKQLVNATCSGATVGDLVTKQRVDGPNIPAQLDTAFAGGTPEFMSITTGANDIHWNEFIYACYTTDCTNNAYDAAAKAYLYAVQAKLHVALSSIYTRSNGTPPTVVITSYYNPFSTACLAQQQNLTAAELEWLTTQATALNTTIQNAANMYSFTRYAPVDFTGHDVCTADSWVQPPGTPTAFHPTAAGQQAIAAAVLGAFRNQ